MGFVQVRDLKSRSDRDENRVKPQPPMWIEAQPEIRVGRARGPVMKINVQNRNPRREHGMVLIYVAILSLVLLGLAGIAVDSALVLSAGQELQNAADGAALNAARYLESDGGADLSFSATRSAAMSVALANEAANTTIKLDANTSNAASGDIVVGHWDPASRTFTPSLSYPNAVRVHATRTASNADGPLGLLFGPLFGKNTSDVGASSTAIMGLPMDPLVLILDPTANNALRINGTNYLEVINGKIQVNSNGHCGLSLVGGPTVKSQLTKVVGGACYPEGTIEGAVVEGADPVPDPLANVLPAPADWNNLKSSMPKPAGANGQIASGGSYEPGYYPKGLNATASEDIHLNPGSYMFGDSFKLGGSAYITGEGVTMFFDKNVDVDISGSGAGMSLTPPAEGPFKGLTYFMHRQSTGPALCKIGGGGLFHVEGIIYVPSGELVMGGTPGKEIGAILVKTAQTEGTTGYTITGKGVPKLSDEISSVYLVE
jgi:Flp pilus assembly protein TadG